MVLSAHRGLARLLRGVYRKPICGPSIGLLGEAIALMSGPERSIAGRVEVLVAAGLVVTQSPLVRLQ